MRIYYIIIATIFCILFCGGHAYAQRQAMRLVGESRYYGYVDGAGKEYTVPVDSIHYGYARNRGNLLKYQYNNLIDTDKYPEMVFLHDPGFYDIYPDKCDTMIKWQNSEDSLFFMENWSTAIYEVYEYDKVGNRLKKTNLMNNVQAIYNYGHKKRLDRTDFYGQVPGTDTALPLGYIMYSYDKNDLLALKKFVPANAPDSAIGILYGYHSDGQINGITSQNRTVTFSYDSSSVTKTTTIRIMEIMGNDSSVINIRFSYVYDNDDLVLYKEEKQESDKQAWRTIIADSMGYDNNHRLVSFKDGDDGLYHNFTIRYNSFGQPVFRTAMVSDEKYTRTLPDGSKARLITTEAHYYYEFYDRKRH